MTDSPEAVMMELVIAAQGRQGSHADAVSKEDLSCSVDPRLAIIELVPVHMDIVPETIERS